jgi:ATP-dependent DNA helicase RecG
MGASRFTLIFSALNESDLMKSFAELSGAPLSVLQSVKRPLRLPGGKREARNRAEALEEMGIISVLDLLTHYPRRYLDRTTQVPISELKEGDDATVIASIRKVKRIPGRRGSKPVVVIDVWDQRSYLKLSFFNQPWRANYLREGMDIAISGKVTTFRGQRQMSNPSVEVIEGEWTGKVVPIYPQSEKAGITSMEIASCVGEALQWAGELEDPVPSGALKAYNFAPRGWSMKYVHQPGSVADKEAARRRLGFDELLRLQLVLVMRKRAVEQSSEGISHEVGSELIRHFRESLPFSLTGAQERAIEEIEADLAKSVPMHRLLQGDVGSGKTLVALWCLLTAVAGGHQGALMAPTEVLADQHYMTLTAMLTGLVVPDSASLWGERGVRVELLTNRTTATERAKLLAGLGNGEVNIVVGTHALLTEPVRFAGLGMVVIDEQHRFGVEQRAALREKSGGAVPDVLVMTATPIPRTAAMTVYGDLDTTVLDELPPGRTPVKTVWARGPMEVELAWATVREEIGKGHQAYVVCPLVEESERTQAKSASEEMLRLAEGPLAGLRLGLLHGQLPAREKQAVMADFRSGELQVLVATTVIEVGVDVPNATVMVVEDADHFGIAQLHQLRGRVGRGAAVSWCYLLAEAPTPEGVDRLAALERTNDGFVLAEVDLDLRGEGTILGTRQKGVNDLKLASLRRHRKYVALAREVAFDIVGGDPALELHPGLAQELRALVDDDDREYLFKN